MAVGAGARCHVVVGAESRVERLDHETAAALLARGEYFWLDLEGPTEKDFAVLRDTFRFHPLAVEDSEHFGQRAKVEDYDDFVLLVVYGAAHDDDRLVEVHCFVSARFLVTVRRDPCAPFDELRRRAQQTGLERPGLVLYRVVESLVGSFFPLLDELDDRIDALEDEIFLRADEAQLQEIFEMKRLLVGVRKAVAPQRDAFAAIAAGVVEPPGLTADDERYFRDVYDHLIRIADLVDSYRDLLTSAMDVYLSTVSNRLNGVMKQLTVIATVFLPLAWLTGFFGQNFSWLVDRVGSWEAFVGVGVGTEVVALVALLVYFRRRGWFSA